MKLCEHPDFEQAILGAAEHFKTRGLRPEIIEKDYYVTETLRAVARHSGDRVIFKGGTSLSKGWNLIHRFSEDVDLFLNPQAFDPPLGKNRIDKELKSLRDAVVAEVGLTFVEADSQTSKARSRSDSLAYKTLFGGAGQIAPRVLLEAGIASGDWPTATRELRSILAESLAETGKSLGAVDEGAFSMRLLHFRRTFVEKLFAIHKRIELLKTMGTPIGSHARHYYDLYQLSGLPEVQALLRSTEYVEIKKDYDRISSDSFPGHHSCPPEMRFSASEAIFPSEALTAIIAPVYEAQCKLLCYGKYPSWVEVMARFNELQPLL